MACRGSDRGSPVMGWTGCFPCRASLAGEQVNRRSSDEAQYADNDGATGGDRHRHWQGDFHLVGFGTDGKVAFRKKIRRLDLKEAFEQLPSCIAGMEACLSAPFVSRRLRMLGHEPRIIPAIYVKPFLKGQKNDYNDAGAIAEAALRPTLRIVQEKSQDQLDRQACHRVRSRLVSRRTATINQIRAFLIEQGIAPAGLDREIVISAAKLHSPHFDNAQTPALGTVVER